MPDPAEAPIVTLADLIERHRANEVAYNEVRTAYEASEETLARAFLSTGYDHADHDGMRWYVDQWTRIRGWVCTPHPDDEFQPPSASSVVVPAGVVGEGMGE